MSLSPPIPSVSLGFINGRLPALGWRRQERLCRFVSVGGLLAGLPGGDGKSYAPSPVWRDSTTKPIKYMAVTKRQAVRLFHDARRFERQTRAPGRQDGALGRNGLAVLHALLFDFLNHATGALWPSKRAIAARACISERSAARGLDSLKAAGIVNWVRRCIEEWAGGRFTLRQLSNAYAVLPVSQWRGFRADPPAPTPDPATWGATPPLPDMVTMAAQASQEAGGRGVASVKAACAALELDEHDGLAARLLSLGRSIIKRNS